MIVLIALGVLVQVNRPGAAPVYLAGAALFMLLLVSMVAIYFLSHRITFAGDHVASRSFLQSKSFHLTEVGAVQKYDYGLSGAHKLVVLVLDRRGRELMYLNASLWDTDTVQTVCDLLGPVAAGPFQRVSERQARRTRSGATHSHLLRWVLIAWLTLAVLLTLLYVFSSH